MSIQSLYNPPKKLQQSNRQTQARMQTAKTTEAANGA